MTVVRSSDLSFKPLTIDDRDVLEPRIRAANFPLCEYTFATQTCWAECNQTQWATFGDFVLIRYDDEGRERFLCPIGVGDPSPAMSWCVERMVSGGFAPEITMVPDRVRAMLCGGPWWFEPDKGNFDYLYLRDDLATLPGGRFSRKRNFIARFLKQHPSWSFDEIGVGEISDCMSFLLDWCRDNDCSGSRWLGFETEAMRNCLLWQDALRMRACALRVDGRIVGLTVGEELAPDTFVVHYEKAHRNIDGAYPMLTREFARVMGEQYLFVNREQDMGEPGLRKSKEQWFPVGVAPAFTLIPR